MSFTGSGPSGPAYNGQQPPARPFPVYTTIPPPPGQPQYQQAGYLPQPPLYPQQHPQNHVQYAANHLHTAQPFDNVLQHATFSPAQYHGQQPYPSQMTPQRPPQMAPQMPTYQTPPMQPASVHAASASQQMPPPSHRPLQASVPGSSPKPSKSRRISAEGGVKKTATPPRRSVSGAVARSPVASSNSRSDPTSILVCLADEFLTKARAAAPLVASSRDANRVYEYHKLIATGLGCLEAALQSNKLSPRAETLVRLRYGSVLCEETENIMDAETTFQSAVALCDKHRLADLKLYVQFSFLKVLFRRNRKAGLIALEGHVKDCQTYKQVYWIYALRFLKASFYLQTGSPTEPHALENLRAVATLAASRGDKAICVLASLLEGLAHLKAMREDAVVRVQTCIAQASKYQLDESVHIPQLDILTHLLDLGCSLIQKAPELTVNKLNALQARMDDLRDSPQWNEDTSDLLLPLRRQPTSSSTISNDTGSVIRPGKGEHDYLVLKSFSKPEAYVLAHAFSGIGCIYKSTGGDKSFDYWQEALKMVSASAKIPPLTPISLHEAIAQEKWRAEVSCYMYVVSGLHSATRSDWAKVNDYIRKLDAQLPKSTGGSLNILAAYLRGVYQQGVGNLDIALRHFSHTRFALEAPENDTSSKSQVEFGVSLLAAMNRLLIMQGERFRNYEQTAELVEQLSKICTEHRDPDIKTAFNLVRAAIREKPELPMNKIKLHIQHGINGAKSTNNIHCLSIALSLLRFQIFEHHISEQAVKSAKAGSVQAKKSGNLLWMSVADGMLAESYYVAGRREEYLATQAAGTDYANESWDRTQ